MRNKKLMFVLFVYTLITTGIGGIYLALKFSEFMDWLGIDLIIVDILSIVVIPFSAWIAFIYVVSYMEKKDEKES